MPHTPAINPPPSTRFLLLGIWSHLSNRRRVQLGLDLVVMLHQWRSRAGLARGRAAILGRSE